MKLAQLNHIQVDYKQKQTHLETAASCAGIHARPVVFGTLIVEK